MYKSLIITALIAGLLLTTNAWAEGDHGAWETDFDKALEIAAKEKKKLLVDFSGSDWCGWCIKLDKEVFALDSFLEKVQQDYVLVLLDFPRNKTVPNKERNQELMNQYGVKGFPTVLLMDPQGNPFARTGYMEGGPSVYLKHMEDLETTSLDLRKKLDEAGSADGEATARSLNQLFDHIDSLGAKGFDFSHHFSIAFPDLGSVVSKAFQIDPENKKGMKLKAALFLLNSGKIDDRLVATLNQLDPANEKGHLEQLLVAQVSELEPRSAEDARKLVGLVEGFWKDKKIRDKETGAWVGFMAGYASLEGMGNPEQAKRFFKKVLEIQPSGSRWSENAKKFLQKIEQGG